MRRIIVSVAAAAALLGTAGLVGTSASASTADRHLYPNSCHDGGQPHAVHSVPAVSPLDGCPQ